MDTAAIKEKILELKKKRNAVILAHNYQPGEVQEMADFTGDSLGLSRKASGTGADTIVFCGVKFMAETAKILSPEKTVIMPDINAGCPMADMITRQGLISLKREHPSAVVVGYVNTTAEVKTEIDICCTSGNAIRVINSLPAGREIIFVPDKYLAEHVSRQTGRRLVTWMGYCPTHAVIMPEDVEKRRREYPGAAVVAHPECRPEVLELCDAVLSTEGMVGFAAKTGVKQIIIGTEKGLIYRLKKENPCREFIPLSENAVCPNMKLTTLEKLLWALEDLKHEIILSGNVIKKARKSVDRMLEIH